MSRSPRSSVPALARSLVAALALAPAVVPAPASAQFGPVEALASRVSDLGFFYARGGLARSSILEDDPFAMASFGVELLFAVAEIPSAEARARQAEATPVDRWILREVEVRRGEEGQADTVYHYDVVWARPAFGPDDIEWTLEVGIGYGQVQGLELRDPTLDLNATIRTLPSLTLYLSYEPIGTYLGLRTGFLRTHAMQVVDDAGTIFNGDAEAFTMGGLVGYALPLGPTWLFAEAGYTTRTFPSVKWTAPAELPAGVPRELDVSGWGLTAGLQFPVK